MNAQETPQDSLPVIRCNTPKQLTFREKELLESLHHSRMNVVLARRQFLALEKKSNVIEQRIHKEKKLTDNKKQVMIIVVSTAIKVKNCRNIGWPKMFCFTTKRTFQSRYN